MQCRGLPRGEAPHGEAAQGFRRARAQERRGEPRHAAAQGIHGGGLRWKICWYMKNNDGMVYEWNMEGDTFLMVYEWFIIQLKYSIYQ